MKIEKYIANRIIITVKEIREKCDWNYFSAYYRLNKQELDNPSDDEEFILSPDGALICGLISFDECEKLNEIKILDDKKKYLEIFEQSFPQIDNDNVSKAFREFCYETIVNAPQLELIPIEPFDNLPEQKTIYNI